MESGIKWVADTDMFQPSTNQVAEKASEDFETHEWLESIGAFMDPPANIITNFGFLKSPKKEKGVSQEADEGYGSVEPEDLNQTSQEKEVESMPTFFDQIYQDIQNNPDMDIDYLITRNYSEAAGILFLARQQAIANWDNCLRVKSREIRSLRVSTVPVTGKRERVKSARQLEREESEAMWQAAKKVKVEKVRRNSKKASAVGGKVPARPRIPKCSVVKTQLKTVRFASRKPTTTISNPMTPIDFACPSPAQPATIVPRAPVLTTVSIPNPMLPHALACPSPAQTSRRQTKKKPSKHQCPVCQKPSRSGTCQCFGCSGWVHFKCAAGAHLNYTSDFRCATCLANDA
ncbi:hypothetical protein B9Z55_000439 [Caenorhabditis nigoni]|uniref:Zinc finger PHD-type domain-containing protein n=1 Tax=Caenorhabditis nigoni TaxID=1611254 RepID=A0A2G5VT70_9PELO|nr:hypothetical protein B9Z55_000439 [Caenorhabditis nigoni]